MMPLPSHSMSASTTAGAHVDGIGITAGGVHVHHVRPPPVTKPAGSGGSLYQQ